MGNIVLLNDTSNWYHWGCTATSHGIKNTLLDSGWKVNPFPITISNGLKELPENLDEFDSNGRFKKFYHNNISIFKAVEKSDQVIVNGEGSLHGYRAVSVGLLYLSYVLKKQIGIPVSIINHSCYPQGKGKYEPQGKAEQMFSKVYPELDNIVVREPYSLEVCKRMGVDSKLAFDCMPLTIARDYSDLAVSPEEKVVLAGCVSFDERLIDLYVKLINHFKAQGTRVEFLIGAAALPAADDRRFVEILSAKCPSGWSLVRASTLEEWFRCIAEAALLISGRFHHTIAAICMGVPYIVFESNTPKISGMLSYLEHGRALSTSDPHLAEEVFARIGNVYGKRSVGTLSDLASLAWVNFHFVQQGVKA